MFFLGTFSENYVISCRVSGFFVCYSNCRTLCLNTEDFWCVWCYCSYREWINIRPFAEYFLTIFITFPSMAVCIVCSLLNIFKCCGCLNLILNNIDTCFLIWRIFRCRDYIIISGCTICFVGKNYCCFVTRYFNSIDYWSTNFNSVNINFFGTSIIFAVSFSCYSYFLSVFTKFDIIFFGWNNNGTIHYGYISIFINSYSRVLKIFCYNFPCKFYIRTVCICLNVACAPWCSI